MFVKECLCLTRVSLLQFSILSFLLICEYCRQYKFVPQQGELAHMVERSLSMREVLGLVPRFFNHSKPCNSVVGMKQCVEVITIF